MPIDTATRLLGARRLAALAVVLGVLMLHAGLGLVMPLATLGEGSGERALRRIEVAFVRDLAPTAPPPAPGAPPSVARPRVATAAALPASSAQTAQGAQQLPAEALPVPPVPSPTPVPDTLAQAAPEPAPKPADETVATPPAAPEPTLAAAIEPPLPAAPPVPAVASPAAAQGFEWPPSTRLSYQLRGNFRGEVQGTAQVDWLRSGARYQVHLDVRVGPNFAPLVSRRMSSDGELSPEGLRPLRYEEETRQVLRETRRRSITFSDTRIVLPGGKEHERLAGVQDSASQFVQLAYLFTLKPELLQPGRSLEVPLALPSNVDRWVYDVLAREVLDTPMGPIETFHVKPRRDTRPGGDLVAEVWFAPSLQYLPVRIKIKQDAETFVDLMLQRAPQQAQKE